MIVIKTVSPADVEAIAPFFNAFLERACSRGCSIPIETLLTGAVAGLSQLWIVSRDERTPLGVAFSSVVKADDESGRAIWVTLAGGFDGKTWMHELRRELHKFREAEGAKYLKWRGRLGWSRVFGLKPAKASGPGLYTFEDPGDGQGR